MHKNSQINFFNTLLIVILPFPFTTLGVNFLSFGDFYLPELFFLVWLFLFFLFGDKKLFKIILSKNSLTLFLFLIGISIVSLVHFDFDFKAFYGRFRSLFFGLMAFIIIFNMRKKMSIALNQKLILFLYSASIMYFLSCLTSISYGYTKVNVSMICFALLVVLLLELKKYNQAFLVAVLSGLVAFLSFWRQNYLIAFALIISTLAVVLYKSIIVKERKILLSYHFFYISGFFVLTVGFIYHYIDLFSNFLNSSESRYKQSIGKTQDILYLGGDDSADVRFESIVYIIDNIFYFMLPNGIINDSSSSGKSIWGGDSFYVGLSIVRDSGFTYCVVTFGWLLCLLFIFNFIFRYLKYEFINLKLNLLRLVFISPGIIAVIFLDGLSFTQLQKIVFLGIGLAFLYPLNYKERLN